MCSIISWCNVKSLSSWFRWWWWRRVNNKNCDQTANVIGFYFFSISIPMEKNLLHKIEFSYSFIHSFERIKLKYLSDAKLISSQFQKKSKFFNGFNPITFYFIISCHPSLSYGLYTFYLKLIFQFDAIKWKIFSTNMQSIKIYRTLVRKGERIRNEKVNIFISSCWGILLVDFFPIKCKFNHS